MNDSTGGGGAAGNRPESADSGELTETITARGHEHVTATHGSTFETTTDEYLTPAGDCILGIEADRAPAAFSEAFVAACRRQSARITVTIEAAGHTDTVAALGSPDLTFASERSAVVRTSDYVDDRTVAIAASQAAGDIDRALVDALASGAELTVRFSVSQA